MQTRTGAADLEHVADLDIDRLPDPEGGMRVLVDADDCRRLLEAGYEVHLLRALPVRPLEQRPGATPITTYGRGSTSGYATPGRRTG